MWRGAPRRIVVVAREAVGRRILLGIGNPRTRTPSSRAKAREGAGWTGRVSGLTRGERGASLGFARKKPTAAVAAVAVDARGVALCEAPRGDAGAARRRLGEPRRVGVGAAARVSWQISPRLQREGCDVVFWGGQAAFGGGWDARRCRGGDEGQRRRQLPAGCHVLTSCGKVTSTARARTRGAARGGSRARVGSRAHP